MNSVDIRTSPVCLILTTSNQERFIGSLIIQALRITPFVGIIDLNSHDGTVQVATSAGASLLGILTPDEVQSESSSNCALNVALKWAYDQNVKELIFLEKSVQWSDMAGLREITNYSLTTTADIVSINTTGTGLPYQTLEDTVTPSTKICAWAFSAKAINRLQTETFDMARLFERLEKTRLVVDDLSCESIVLNQIEQAPRSGTKRKFTINNLVKFIGQNRPLLFFGLPGLICLIAGLILGLITCDIYYKWHVLALGYALMAVMLVIIGTLGLFVGIILHSVKAFVSNLKKSIEVNYHPKPDFEA